MKTIFLLSATLIMCCLLISSCKKKEDAKYSTWSIDNTSYSSNNVTVTTGHNGYTLESHDHDKFEIFGKLASSPLYGNYPMSHTGGVDNDPAIIFVAVYLNDVLMYVPAPSNNTQLIGTQVDGKAHYTLTKGWFWNPYTRTDSVLVEGVFNEP